MSTLIGLIRRKWRTTARKAESVSKATYLKESTAGWLLEKRQGIDENNKVRAVERRFAPQWKH